MSLENVFCVNAGTHSTAVLLALFNTYNVIWPWGTWAYIFQKRIKRRF